MAESFPILKFLPDGAFKVTFVFPSFVTVTFCASGASLYPSFEAKIAVEGEDDSSDDEDLKPSDEPSAEPTETPDDSEAPSAGDNADASLEAQSLEVNTGSLNFSDIEENYTQANETLSVTVTNTGDGTVTLKKPQYLLPSGM